jgi:hypothetical protein
MIDTTNIPKNTGNFNKILSPGNHLIKIYDIVVEKAPYDEKAIIIKLKVQGPDIENDFEGFYINPEKPELGRFKGPIGLVKSNLYAYQDKTFDNGNQIKRDTEILKFIALLCDALKCQQWLIGENKKHATLSSLLTKFKKDKPYLDVYFHACIGGKEYQNKQGFINHDLFLVKPSNGFLPIVSKDDLSDLVIYNESEHIVKLKEQKEVSNFEKPASNPPLKQNEEEDDLLDGF